MTDQTVKGSLRDHDVQQGDVVRGNNCQFTVSSVNESVDKAFGRTDYDDGTTVEDDWWHYDDDPDWVMVSCATPKAWYQMTDIERRDISFAAMSGQTIELLAEVPGHSAWLVWDGKTPLCEVEQKVRIKAAPRIEVVKMFGNYHNGVWAFDSARCIPAHTHFLTITTRDGNPIAGTFRDEDGNEITLGLVEHADAPQPEKVSGDNVEALVCCGCGKPSTHGCMADCGIALCGAPLCDECVHIDEKVGWRHGRREQSSITTGSGGEK
ncbi:hypothetical protein [Marivivens aquimaris]|uniref:hypothetical protein n=1 Tax=Marivivens aquimaris TaxID=2774876 RepID=UPI00187FE609|nr:hypothetical protein [Marivivens aquimaris]